MENVCLVHIFTLRLPFAIIVFRVTAADDSNTADVEYGVIGFGGKVAYVSGGELFDYLRSIANACKIGARNVQYAAPPPHRPLNDADTTFFPSVPSPSYKSGNGDNDSVDLWAALGGPAIALPNIIVVVLVGLLVRLRRRLAEVQGRGGVAGVAAGAAGNLVGSAVAGLQQQQQQRQHGRGRRLGGRVRLVRARSVPDLRAAINAAYAPPPPSVAPTAPPQHQQQLSRASSFHSAVGVLSVVDDQPSVPATAVSGCIVA
jgi:hypothetical protein